MAITPEDLLAAAGELLAGEREVDWRNAASRAYYAAFHRCQSVARDENLLAYGGGTHAGLIDTFTKLPRKQLSLKALGYMLQHVRVLRNHADYEITSLFEQSLAKSTVANCEGILSKADRLSPLTSETP